MAYNGINSKGMHEYEYVRVYTSSNWDCPENPARLDGGGNQIRLEIEIDTALPGKSFTLHAFGIRLLLWFSAQLSAGEETTLDSTVSDHKANA